MWLALGVIELLCAVCLILPAVSKRLGKMVPPAAAFIVAEMLLYCGLDSFSGEPDYAHIMYWLVVAAISASIAYGRFALKPIQTITKEGSES